MMSLSYILVFMAAAAHASELSNSHESFRYRAGSVEDTDIVMRNGRNVQIISPHHRVAKREDYADGIDGNRLEPTCAPDPLCTSKGGTCTTEGPWPCNGKVLISIFDRSICSGGCHCCILRPSQEMCSSLGKPCGVGNYGACKATACNDGETTVFDNFCSGSTCYCCVDGKTDKGGKTYEESLVKPKLNNFLMGNTDDPNQQIYDALSDIGNKARGCTSYILGDGGTIHFSNAERTDNWWLCFWSINTKGSVFEITFQNFSMKSCERLVIGTWVSPVPLAIFWGNTSEPGSVRLPNRNAWIMFLSSCQTKTAEFTLSWNTVESGCNCLINNDYGMMTYPARITTSELKSKMAYTNNESCTWVISSSRPLQINFHRIYTEECCDFIFVRDGNTSKSDILAILRGNMSDTLVNTTSNSAHIQFTSDFSNVQRGFWMYWKVVAPTTTAPPPTNTPAPTSTPAPAATPAPTTTPALATTPVLTSTAPPPVPTNTYASTRTAKSLAVRSAAASPGKKTQDSHMVSAVSWQDFL